MKQRAGRAKWSCSGCHKTYSSALMLRRYWWHLDVIQRSPQILQAAYFSPNIRAFSEYLTGIKITTSLSEILIHGTVSNSLSLNALFSLVYPFKFFCLPLSWASPFPPFKADECKDNYHNCYLDYLLTELTWFRLIAFFTVFLVKVVSRLLHHKQCTFRLLLNTPKLCFFVLYFNPDNFPHVI